MGTLRLKLVTFWFFMVNRIDKINSLLRRLIAEMISEEISAEGVLLTVNRVEITPDLERADVFLAIHPSEKRNIWLRKVRKRKSKFQKELGGKIKFKKTPQLTFALDPAIIKVEKIESVINKIRKNDR